MPSTVGTADSHYAVSFGHQRKGFHAVGRFWVFYCPADNLYYKTSLDGINWTDAINLGAVLDGFEFSIWFDGTYVHYVRTHVSNTYYRRGTPQSDGSISWSAVEQTVHTGSLTNQYRFPCVSVDSGGYAWLGARYYDGKRYYAYVLKNANNNGTWSTQFSYQLSKTYDSTWKVQPVPLNALRVYVTYCRNNALPLGVLYSAGWGNEENDLADYNVNYGYAFSAVNEGDNVHFMYLRYGTYQLRYNKRTYGVGWGVNDVLVQNNMEDSSCPALCIDLSNNLYCIWTLIATDHVYYKKCVKGVWDTTPTDWVDESVDDIQDGWSHNAFYKSYDDYTGLLYVTKLVSPYNVRFAFLYPVVPQHYELERSLISIERINPEVLIKRNARVIGSRDSQVKWVSPSPLKPVSPETGKVMVSTMMQQRVKIKPMWSLMIHRNGDLIYHKKRIRDLFVWRGQSIFAYLLSQGVVGTATSTWYVVASENANAPDMGDDSGNPDANEFSPLIGTPVAVTYEFEPTVKPSGWGQTYALITIKGTVTSDGSKTLRKIGIRDNVAIPNRHIVCEDSVVPFSVILNDTIEISYMVRLG